MANPQPTEHTRLSNELFAAIMNTDFSKRQRRIIDLIIRMSYGCGKKTALLRHCDYEIVGVGRNHIKAELQALVEAKVLVIDGEITTLNKDYEQWTLTKIDKTNKFNEILRRNLSQVTEMGIQVPKTGTGNLDGVPKTGTKVPETGTGNPDNVPETGTKVPEMGTGNSDGVPETGTDSSQNGNSAVPKTGTGTVEKPSSGKRFRLPKEILKKIKDNKRSISPYIPPKGGRDSPDTIQEVYKYYCQTIRECQLTKTRRTKIGARLKEYTIDQLRSAIDNLAADPWIMGENPNGKFYATLEYVFRSTEKTEEWLKKFDKPKSGGVIPNGGTHAPNRNIGGRTIDEDPIPVKKLIIRADDGEVTDLSDLP